ncbi:dynamin family protein [uncultured Acetatifactor sp.]|uniref:dynamin family protein n=1 Tax=uncultured Acetatifactor sp. TaxID=1671927 RepID=UPI002618C58A|nr:dynamin family protein [uncultured Acetatifactor sp.]
MKKVFIKYNPYKIETEIRIEGKKLAENSILGEKIVPGARLQEWVEELPQILIDEYNDRDFEIIFHGTLLDYEDLAEAFTLAFEEGELEVTLDRQPAKETEDKEVLIEQVFEKIKKGPFDELRDEEVINSFEHARSSEFEVCVVATMSAGKSTLINSMLRTKLMPSKMEACTAIITRIKDNDSPGWQAEVYNKENRLIETQEDLTNLTMNRLNEDSQVSLIKVTGNIPFVSAEDVSLVLIDTPGPNNSRNPEHRKVQSEFLGKSSKSLVLYIMEGTFGSDDDNLLLEKVADSMSVGGKQSKDRFIFVVNKMDDRKKEDGDTEQTLGRIRSYLKMHGIVNPNLFPAAALPALNIRMIENGQQMDEDTIDETEVKVKKLNRNENMHFENFAPLPRSVREEINAQLLEASDAQDTNGQALIHTGVMSVEAAIRQYVRKYAKTAKIKNIVDTFIHKLDAVGCFEETKKELASRQDENEQIVRQIELINKKVDDVKEARKFHIAVDDAVVKVNEDAREVVEGIIEKFQQRVRKKIDELRGTELEMGEVEYEMQGLEKFARKLEPDFQVELDELIKKNLVDSVDVLLQNYRKKLKSLTEELDGNVLQGITIDPLRFMSGNLSSGDSFSIHKLVQTKQVEDGEEWVKNTDKKWYKPWTWFQESGYTRTKYKTVKYVDGGEMADEFLQPIQNVIYENGENATKYALKQSKKISETFKKEFQKLDMLLKNKLGELKSFATDKEQAEARIRESERKLQWLKEIKDEVESILEI